MSSDLLAAFDDLNPNQNASTKQNVASALPHHQHNNLAPGGDVDVGLDEEFGDFEDAGVPTPPVQPPSTSISSQKNEAVTAQEDSDDWFVNAHQQDIAPKPSTGRLPFAPKPPEAAKDDSRIGRHPFADHMDVLFAADDNEYNAGQDEWNDLSNNPEAAMAYSKRIIQEQMEAQSQQKAKEVTPTASLNATLSIDNSQQSFKPRNLDVLFDADDLSDGTPEDSKDDDIGDWGDFEETENDILSTKTSRAPPVFSYTSTPFLNIEQPTPRKEAAVSASFDLLGLDEPAPRPVTPETTQGLEPRQVLARSPASFNRIIEQGFAIDAGWDDFDATVPVTSASQEEQSATASQTDARRPSIPKVPPANIPPPSVLISAFPEMLKQPLQPKAVSERIANANVLAHVLAGRKLRWKRCSVLAASMRIGPAAAGGKGGMKLTGLDRTETVKEEREVAEVMSAWRAQLGRLRSAYTTFTSANSAEGRLLQAKLPEVNDPAPIKTLKAQEGGLTAPHECALCGLKRQERVVHVDDNVEDSFGEWWAEGADMHMFCLKWWTEHEQLLRSR